MAKMANDHETLFCFLFLSFLLLLFMCKKIIERVKGTCCFVCLYIFSFICRVVVYWLLLVLCSRRGGIIYTTRLRFSLFPFFFHGPAITRRVKLTYQQAKRKWMKDLFLFLPFLSLFLDIDFFAFSLFRVVCSHVITRVSVLFPFDSWLVLFIFLILYPAKMSFAGQHASLNRFAACRDRHLICPFIARKFCHFHSSRTPTKQNKQNKPVSFCLRNEATWTICWTSYTTSRKWPAVYYFSFCVDKWTLEKGK